MPTSISMTILMCVVVALARSSDRNMVIRKTPSGTVIQERVFTFLIVFALSFYASLRTRGNDTTGYIRHFTTPGRTPTLSEYFSQDIWNSSKGPLFELLRSICKHHIADNYHVFFFVAALITNALIITFLRRYSTHFPVSVFLYLAMDGYGVSLTGMRQALATAIAIWLIPAVARKKWSSFALILFIAYQVHFVVILYPIILFFAKKVWNKMVVLTMVGAIVSIFMFPKIGNMMLDVTETLGFSYQESTVFGMGVNIFRILVYTVPAGMALIFRRRMAHYNRMETISTNMTIAGSALTLVGIKGNANTFGRFGLMMEPSIYMALPQMVQDAFPNPKTRHTITIVMIVCFLIYYMYGFVKNGFWLDYYGLISIF